MATDLCQARERLVPCGGHGRAPWMGQYSPRVQPSRSLLGRLETDILWASPLPPSCLKFHVTDGWSGKGSHLGARTHSGRESFARAKDTRRQSTGPCFRWDVIQHCTGRPTIRCALYSLVLHSLISEASVCHSTFLVLIK